MPADNTDARRAELMAMLRRFQFACEQPDADASLIALMAKVFSEKFIPDLLAALDRPASGLTVQQIDHCFELCSCKEDSDGPCAVCDYLIGVRKAALDRPASEPAATYVRWCPQCDKPSKLDTGLCHFCGATCYARLDSALATVESKQSSDPTGDGRATATCSTDPAPPSITPEFQAAADIEAKTPIAVGAGITPEQCEAAAKWLAVYMRGETSEALKKGNEAVTCLCAAAAWGRERDKLQAFKDWVHSYLDTHGVPHHPPGTHGAEGCRIGDRMDWLMAQLAASRKRIADWERAGEMALALWDRGEDIRSCQGEAEQIRYLLAATPEAGG